MQHATWVRLHACTLVTMAMLAAGSALLYYYFWGPESHLTIPRQGLGTAMSNTMHLNLLRIALDAHQSPPTLSLYGQLDPVTRPSEEDEPVYLMFVLPFRVEALVQPAGAQYSGLRWEYISGNATVTYAKVANRSDTFVPSDFNVEFRIARTFEVSKRGIHTIVLPFQPTGVGGPGFPEVENLKRELRVGLVTPLADNVEVYIILPIWAANIEGFPEPTSITTWMDDEVQSVKWVLGERQTITLSYVDSTSKALYEIFVVVGSLLVGASFSGLREFAKDVSTKAKESGLYEWRA